jgi:hypothetical protein
MADIPPNVANSAAQAGYVQSEASRTRNAARAGQAQAARDNVKAVDEAGDTISTDEEDTQVYTDSEGTGGKGREHEEEHPESSIDEDQAIEDGIRRDEDGKPHLDIQA